MKGWMLDSIMKDTVCVSRSQSVVNLTQQGNQTLASLWLWSSRARCCKRDIKLETKTNYCADLRVYRAQIKSFKDVCTWKTMCACVYMFKLSGRTLQGHTHTLTCAVLRQNSVSQRVFVHVSDIRSPLSLSSRPIHLSASVWSFLSAAWPTVTMDGAAWLDGDQEVFGKVISITMFMGTFWNERGVVRSAKPHWNQFPPIRTTAPC